MNCGTKPIVLETGYTEEELYNLFCKFYDRPGALRLLADFMGVTKNEYAQEMFDKFKKRKSGAIT